MENNRRLWDPSRRADAYSELEHPSDLFLEIRGHDLPGLVENALFAFYDQIAEIGAFEPRRELTLSVREPGLDEALRSLLAEALYRFDTEGFVAAGGEVTVRRGGENAARDAGRTDESGAPAGGLPAGEAAPSAGSASALGSEATVPGSGAAAPDARLGAAPGVRLTAARAPGDWHLLARLWGQNAERGRHTLLHEIKAVTYHRLSVSEGRDGWKATVLLDI